MAVYYTNTDGSFVEDLGSSERNAERDRTMREGSKQPRKVTRGELAQAQWMADDERREQEWAQTMARAEANQRAAQQAVFDELRGPLDSRLEKAVSDAETALRSAQNEAQQATAAVERHSAVRPRAGASPKDIDSWIGEHAMLDARAKLYAGHVTEAAAAHQTAAQAMQAGMRQVFEQRRFELQRELEGIGRANQVKCDAARAEVDRVIIECTTTYNTVAERLSLLHPVLAGCMIPDAFADIHRQKAKISLGGPVSIPG